MSYKFLYLFISLQFQVQGKFVLAPLRWLLRLPQQRTSSASACYLYISLVLVILEVVFQFFSRLLRMPQYLKPWAITYMRLKNLHEPENFLHMQWIPFCADAKYVFHIIVSVSQ